MESSVDMVYASGHQSMFHRYVLEKVSLETIHSSLSTIGHFGDLLPRIQLGKIMLMHHPSIPP